MAAPVSVRVRQEVAERAAYRCEYCGLPQRFALHAHEPDHIVPRQHGIDSERLNRWLDKRGPGPGHLWWRLSAGLRRDALPDCPALLDQNSNRPYNTSLFA
jgi:hypothetical protein